MQDAGLAQIFCSSCAIARGLERFETSSREIRPNRLPSIRAGNPRVRGAHPSPTPDAQFVKGALQLMLDDRFGCAHQFADFGVGKTLPHPAGHSNFLLREALARCHKIVPCLCIKGCNRKFHPLAAIPDSSAQKERVFAEEVLHGTRDAARLTRNFLVARTLEE
jgi:hypothetical protein